MLERVVETEHRIGQVDGVLAGRVVAFGTFDPTVQTERVTILAESDLAESDRDGEEARATVVQTRQWIQAAFELAAFEVHLVPRGWLVKSSSGKIARSANRDKWQREEGCDAHPLAGARTRGTSEQVGRRVGRNR
jgi:acyl-CoA synthetase (AMP-forming)/AMP-acid ligase II